MSIYERQTKILNHLKSKQFATVKELAGIVWSSESSVRRDIKLLEANGYAPHKLAVSLNQYSKFLVRKTPVEPSYPFVSISN